ncbi:MAG: cytochrome c oxidase assembly protein [Proteobacteria bacterium]|jgi:cytochrome c oxidase assembly protein subunit 11|nr:cytochrome c oxidase assembly protein [Pseudomonadota bacterium]MDA0971399.1 cytochrome c oxidase assembly protein [Pseudomonadota bacterium]MDA0995395.1 cytochrome c oxidase assembly protein [Pseudomonadota bacterium]
MSTLKTKKLNPMYLVAIFFIMLGLSFASVPLYDLFCRITGFGGTTQKTTKIPNVVVDKNIGMRFDTNIAGNLDVRFEIKENKLDIKPGEIRNAAFVVTNQSPNIIKVISTFNVSPDSVGKYFNKLECFCFEQQAIPIKGKREFNVSYYIDPEIANDPQTKNVKDITLSYTLFEVDKFKK